MPRKSLLNPKSRLKYRFYRTELDTLLKIVDVVNGEEITSMVMHNVLNVVGSKSIIDEMTNKKRRVIVRLVIDVDHSQILLSN